MTSPDQQASPYTGDLEQVLQEEPATLRLPPVQVDVRGVVPVHTVGSRAGAHFSKGIPDDAVAVKLISSDNRRRVVRIVVTGQTVYIGTDQASCNQSVAFLVPTGVPIEITHIDDLWVRNPNAGTVATVSVMVENWAD